MNEPLQSMLLIAGTLLAVIAVAAVVFVLIVKIQTASRRRRIEGYGRESEQRIDALLRKNFTDNAVMSGVYLPYLRSKDGKHAEIDHLVINRSGVYVIEVKSHNGFIRCPDEKMWWQTYNDKKISFYNPIRQNHTHTKIVSEILRSEGQYNVPVYSVVVFTSRRVTFSEKHDNVIGGDQLVPYIRRTGRKNALSTSQVGRVRRIIKDHAAKDRSTARRHRANVRGHKR
ncbi:MAG: NERD domain-containing protein [Ruminococcaceae bacterium]|nr:NERD domain-containing protein [Oscillospiraceae bacterium]